MTPVAGGRARAAEANRRRRHRRKRSGAAPSRRPPPRSPRHRSAPRRLPPGAQAAARWPEHRLTSSVGDEKHKLSLSTHGFLQSAECSRTAKEFLKKGIQAYPLSLYRVPTLQLFSRGVCSSQWSERAPIDVLALAVYLRLCCGAKWKPPGAPRAAPRGPAPRLLCVHKKVCVRAVLPRVLAREVCHTSKTIYYSRKPHVLSFSHFSC